jgi:hypothetical protein
MDEKLKAIALAENSTQSEVIENILGAKIRRTIKWRKLKSDRLENT